MILPYSFPARSLLRIESRGAVDTIAMKHIPAEAREQRVARGSINATGELPPAFLDVKTLRQQPGPLVEQPNRLTRGLTIPPPPPLAKAPGARGQAVFVVHPALSWLAIHTNGSFRTRTRPQ